MDVSLLKRRVLTLFILIALLFPAIILSVPTFINLDNLIEGLISDDINRIYKKNDFVISSTANWSSFPPEIKISGVRISGSDVHSRPIDINVGSGVIKLNLAHLITAKIIPVGMDIEWFSISDYALLAIIKHLSSDVTLKKLSGTTLKFSSGLLNLSEIASNHGFDTFIQMNNGKVDFLKNGFSFISGVSLGDQSPYKLQISASGKDPDFIYQNFELSISSLQNGSITATGSVRDDILNIDIKGKGKNFASLLHDVLLYTKKSSFNEEDFSFSGQMSIYRKGKIEGKDFKLDSDLVSLSSKFNIKENSDSSINIKVGSFDLDHEMDLFNLLLKILSTERFIKKGYGYGQTDIKVSVKKLPKNGLSAGSLELFISGKGREFKIKKADMLLPGFHNMAKLTGGITFRGVSPILNCHLSLYGNDFSSAVQWASGLKLKNSSHFMLEAKVKLSPKTLLIPELTLLSSNGKVRAYIRKKMFNNKSFTFYKLNGKRINFDDFKYDFNEEFKSIVSTEHESPDKESDAMFLFEDSSKNGVKLDQLSFSANSYMNEINIRDLLIKGDKIDVTGEVYSNLNPNSNKQQIQAEFTGETFNAALLKRPALLTVERNNDTSRKIRRIVWNDKYSLDFSPFARVDAKFIAKFSNWFIDDKHSLKDFYINATAQRNRLKIEDFSFGLGDGMVKILGELISSRSESIMKGVASIRSVPIKEFMKVISGKDYDTSGVMAANINLSAYGNTLSQVVNHTNGNANIVFAGLKVNDINIDGFFEKLFSANTESEIGNLTQILLYDGHTVLSKGSLGLKFRSGIISGVGQFNSNYSGITSSFLINSAQMELNGRSRFFFLPPGLYEPLQSDAKISGYPWDIKIGFSTKDLHDIISKTNNSKK